MIHLSFDRNDHDVTELEVGAVERDPIGPAAFFAALDAVDAVEKCLR